MRTKSITRHSNILKRKNFLPTLVLTILLWLTIGALVYFVDPDVSGAILLFFLLTFLALLFTFSTLLANSRRGLITSLCLIIFLIFRYFGIGNILNLILILALGICAELYCGRKN